jgi:hypothetical protein
MQRSGNTVCFEAAGRISSPMYQRCRDIRGSMPLVLLEVIRSMRNLLLRLVTLAQTGAKCIR